MGFIRGAWEQSLLLLGRNFLQLIPYQVTRNEPLRLSVEQFCLSLTIVNYLIYLYVYLAVVTIYLLLECKLC